MIYIKIAIYGAGSIGTILGAYLTKAGQNVDLITRNKEHVDAMNQNGAKVICTMQNGLPEVSVSKIIGEERTIGCAVGWGQLYMEKESVN